LTSTLSSVVLNKLSFEVSQRRAVERTETSTGPGVLIPGVALFSTPYFGNSRRFETHLEVADGFSLQVNHHLIQTGINVDRIALRASVPDSSQGFFVFPTLADLSTGKADFFSQSFGNFDTNFSELRLAAYAQDHWNPARTLTVDYGLRYEYNRLPSSLPQDDAINFSPRIGIAWTPRPTLVVRGGFGIFYDRFQLSTINRILQQDGTHGFTQIMEDQAAATLYRSGNVPLQHCGTSLPASGRRNPTLPIHTARLPPSA
jgi:hypothetical protein